MEKVKIEQIVAGMLLLGFDKINSMDIIKFSEYCLRDIHYLDDVDVERVYRSYKKGCGKYVEIDKNNDFVLKDGYSLDTFIEEENKSLRNILEDMVAENEKVNNTLQFFDLEEFVLRKVKYHEAICDSDIERLYCNIQKKTLKKLEEKGYLIATWEEDDAPYDDYKVLRVSDKGMLRLFKVDYASEIERFISELKSRRYDVSILDDYLMKQDLDSDNVWSILNVDKIDEFCNTYDRANLEPGVTSVCYQKLKCHGNSYLNDNKGLMQDMLSVWDEGHSIYISHPNNVFNGEKLLTFDVEDIKHVNWNYISMEKMFLSKNYGAFTAPDGEKAFDYVNNNIDADEDRNGYLVVVEEYLVNKDSYYLVRGIIKKDKDGYSIGFNPEYQKWMPKNKYEKILRISGRVVSEGYTLKRKTEK